MSNKWKQNQVKANGNAQKGGAAAVMPQQSGGMIPAYPRQAKTNNGGKQKRKKAAQRAQQETVPPTTVQSQPPLTQSASAKSTSRNEATQPTEPQKKVELEQQKSTKSTQEAAKRQPERHSEEEKIGSPTWASKVDSCLAELTQLTKEHHLVLDDHERRIRKLEQWREKDSAFAKKAAPIIAELQRDSELSDERLGELEDQLWSIWAHHLDIEPVDQPEMQAKVTSDSDEDNDVKTVEDLVELETVSRGGSEPVAQMQPKVAPKPADKKAEMKLAVATPSGKPKKIYKYWDFSTRTYGLTSDIWKAKQIYSGYVPVWAWYVGDELDHLMSTDELRKYLPEEYLK